MNQFLEEQYKNLGISREVYEFGEKIEESLKERFAEIDARAEYNQMKVIKAMQENRVSAECFNMSSGYGYNDLGRDTLEKVYASCFKGEDALVRPQITCGTHALALALMSNLRPGDELMSPVGKPYDTLEEVIGIRPSKGSLAEYGVTYSQVDLLPDGSFDYENIKKAINDRTKLVTIQRSKGYATRPTLSVTRIGELISFIKNIKPDVICMVDNCYGEFVEEKEPLEVGADMIVGSLIKNPGGGLAPIGGYIAGKRESRRLLGDYVLKEDDLTKHVAHEDASFTTTWSIDLHRPDPENTRYFPGREFKATTDHVVIYPYPVPYRCLYSRNIDNLFMAGRNISVTHVALGTVRVMRTTGMMGEVVGMAASLCKKYQATPRDIYHYYLEELKSLMQKGVNKKGLPNNQRYNEGGRLNQIPKVK